MRSCSILLLSLLSVRAVAQDGEPRVQEARAHFDLAEQHYERTDFALALAEYRASYEIMHSIRHPNAGMILFNMAHCYSRLNRDCEAVRAYEQSLVEAPADFAERATAEQELRELRARLDLAGTGCGGGVSPVGPIVLGVGGAALLAGAILGAVALSVRDAATTGCVAGRCPPENEAFYEEAQLYANLADGFLFGGLGVAAVGVLLLFVVSGDSGEPPVSATASANHVMLFAQGRF
jgi:tetratricopeptide (TPR) repeat protein